MPRRLAQLLTALALLVSARTTGAWCRSSVCPCTSDACAARGDDTEQGRVCEPPEPGDCGTPLQWRQPCVGFTVQQDGSSQIPLGSIHDVAAEAFAAWITVGCGEGSPSIQVDDLGDVACDEVEYNQRGGNANILMFRELVWPHQTTGVDALALTTVTYDADTGAIYDADIEVNAVMNTFTTADVTMDVDLVSVLTHEAGHFLGVAHSEVPEATMAPSYTNGTTSLRSLTPDDEAVICAVYPPDRPTSGECTFLPRHGFSPACMDEQTEGSCSAVAGAPAGDSQWLVGAVVIAIAARRRAITARSARRAR